MNFGGSEKDRGLRPSTSTDAGSGLPDFPAFLCVLAAALFMIGAAAASGVYLPAGTTRYPPSDRRLPPATSWSAAASPARRRTTNAK